MKQKLKTLLLVGGLATLTMHVLNRVEYSRCTSRNLLNNNQNKYYEWRFGKIRYTIKGSGNPILLIHDLTVGSSSYEYHKLIDELSINHEVYSLDLLGYGLSDKPNMTYTNYLFVQMVSDFIKNIIGHKTDVIASGDSVPVAIMTCHNDSNLINNIIAINPQNLFQLNQIPSKQTRIMKFILDTPIVGTFIYNLFTSKSKFTTSFQHKLYYNPYDIEEKSILAYAEAAHTTDFHSKHTLASYIGRYTNSNIVHALKEINKSIYIIAGEEKDNNHTIVENYEYYNQAIESVFIPKTKQLPHLEKEKEVLSHIQTFLSSQ
ncbi:alpha/beta hydrolase [Lachnospiraceae bacterium OttesenSCG-928-D06]|nr:alpha/beta hydrolase [Lachnospiraceae bacterium OttesenSCG-928-D06]